MTFPKSTSRQFAAFWVLLATALILLTTDATAQSRRQPPAQRSYQTMNPEDLCSPDGEPDVVSGGETSNQPVIAPIKPHARPNPFKQLLEDQKAIWTSPLHTNQEDVKWMAPLAATAAVLFATDEGMSGGLSHSEELSERSHRVSILGSGWVTFGAASAFYVSGMLTANTRAQETGLLGIEALVNSSIVVGALKFAAGRERPTSGVPEPEGSFFRSGKSFPSGHASTIWTLSAVIGEEYSDKPLIKYGAYAAAAAVSISRFTGRNHFPSDVLVGGTIGYLIGRYTVRRHGQQKDQQGKPENRIVIAPYVSRLTHAYGVSALVTF